MYHQLMHIMLSFEFQSSSCTGICSGKVEGSSMLCPHEEMCVICGKLVSVRTRNVKESLSSELIPFASSNFRLCSDVACRLVPVTTSIPGRSCLEGSPRAPGARLTPTLCQEISFLRSSSPKTVSSLSSSVSSSQPLRADGAGVAAGAVVVGGDVN